jgi:heme A synthase
MILILGPKILVRAVSTPTLIRQSTWVIMILVVAQIIIGGILIIVGLPEIIQLFHLWLASLMAGAILILFVSLKPAGEM